MMFSKRKVWLAVGFVVASMFATGCSGQSGINVVELAGLEKATALEILELELDAEVAGDEMYLSRAMVTQGEVLAQIIATIDLPIEVTPRVICIPEFRLRFYLSDGTIEEIEYSCDAVSYLRGEQAFWEAQDFAPPEAFSRLIAEQLELASETQLNIMKLSRLASAQELRILENVIGDDGTPTGSEILTITDLEALGRVLRALNHAAPRTPRARCLPRYELAFRLPDGSEERFGYSCDGESPSFLRGEQAYWQNQDIQPSAEFDALFSELVGLAK